MTLQLLALFMLPVCLLMVLAPARMMKILKEWGASPALQFMSSLFIFLLALLIVISTGFDLTFWGTGMGGAFVWEWSSQVILSWIAVLMILKGIAHFFPKAVAWKMKLITEARIPMFGFLALLFFMGMVYLETQVF